jgi:hypothetical protein
LALPAGAFSALAAEGAAVPPRLLVETAQAAGRNAAGTAGGAVSAAAAGLAGGVLRTMFLSKCKIVAGVLVAVGLTALGLGSVGGADPVQSAVLTAAAPDHHDKKAGDGKAEPVAGEQRLRKLREEKLKIAQEICAHVHKLRMHGKASFMEAAKSHHLVCKAELELATTDAERVKILTKLVDMAKQIEENAKKLRETGAMSAIDFLNVTVDRLDAEIALEKARTAAGGALK